MESQLDMVPAIINRIKELRAKSIAGAMN